MTATTTECYLCQNNPLKQRERANATFLECDYCDHTDGDIPPSHPDRYPREGR